MLFNTIAYGCLVVPVDEVSMSTLSVTALDVSFCTVASPLLLLLLQAGNANVANANVQMKR